MARNKKQKENGEAKTETLGKENEEPVKTEVTGVKEEEKRDMGTQQADEVRIL